MSRDRVNVDGFWIVDRIYWTFDTAREYTLQFTITHTHTHTHTLVFTITPSLPLLGSGFQRRIFPLLWGPERSPASATSFSQRLNCSSSPTNTPSDSSVTD
jgi:hypothetical protein